MGPTRSRIGVCGTDSCGSTTWRRTWRRRCHGDAGGDGVALAHTVDAPIAVAHVSRGDVERFAAEATMEINADALEDRRGVAELLARLRTREVELERSERGRYDAALVKWRTLRTERGVSLFAELIQSERMSRRTRSRRGTRCWRTPTRSRRCSPGVSTATALSTLVGSLSRAGVELNPVGVKRWAAGLSARCDAWDGACALGLKRLETLESTLRAEADEALATVVAAVEEYAGPIMDRRAREKLVRKRCVKVYDRRNADAARLHRARSIHGGAAARGVATQVRVPDAIRAARREVSRRAQGAGGGYPRERFLPDVTRRGTEHERVDAAKEGAFDAACEDIAVAADEAEAGGGGGRRASEARRHRAQLPRL